MTVSHSHVRKARVTSTVLLVLAVVITGTMLWRGLQSELLRDVRRDLLLDAAHVRLLQGFEGADALSVLHDAKATNPDRDAIAIPVRRRSALEWDVEARPGRFTMEVARLAYGPAADATPCTVTVKAMRAVSSADEAALLGSAQVDALPCPALEGADPALWREGPACRLELQLPHGARTLRIEISSPDVGADRVPGDSFLVLLSPRVDMEPLRTPLAEASRTVLVEQRLLPDVPAAPVDVPQRLFATRRSAEAPDTYEDVLLPPVQALAAFTGPVADGRPAVALTGETSVSWTVDLEPDSVLRAAFALDDRLPPGSSASIEVRVDGALIASTPVDSVHWRELSLPLGAQAGPGRRLECALVTPRLEPAEVRHDDPDFVAGVMRVFGYTARLMRVGLADPRLVRERQVPVRRATSGRPSVILIQVETLRADALGVLAAVDEARGASAATGAPGATGATGAQTHAPAADVVAGAGLSRTPNLDAFAAHSTVWQQAFTPAPWTEPTTVSLLTGLTPTAHGAVDHDRLVVPGDVATLAELAGAAGVATGAVVASEIVRPQAGFARGFDSFVHVPYANARQVNDFAGAFLANHAGEQFLLFLHYFDPHSPCNAPGAWRDRYVDEALRGLDLHAVEQRMVAEMKLAREEGRPPAPDEADVRFLRQRYAGEVAWFDSQFRALLERIEALGLSGSTLVVLTSDHGEEFFEHGLYGHGSALFDETLHVPLFVSGPRGLPGLSLSGTRITTPVSTVGLFASVLRWLDAPFDAASVRPPLDAPERAVYSETSKGIAPGDTSDPLRRHLHRVRSADGLLLWREPVDDEPQPGERQYFDLRTDPGALVPLSADSDAARPLWQELLHALEWSGEHLASSPLPGGDAGLLQSFQSLGYIGDGAPAPKAPR